MVAGDPLAGLMAWYLAQCDGDWEHEFGVAIGTLDNPGWSLRIDLMETDLAGVPFERVEDHRSETDWVVCWLEGERFEGACGPLNLAEMVDRFLAWAGTGST